MAVKPHKPSFVEESSFFRLHCRGSGKFVIVDSIDLGIAAPRALRSRFEHGQALVSGGLQAVPKGWLQGQHGSLLQFLDLFYFTFGKTN